MVINPYRTAVYRLYDRGGMLLYVGMGAVRERLLAHAREKDWWPRVDRSRTRVVWYPNRAKAARAERIAIHREGPAYNVLGTPEHQRRMVEVRRRMVATGVVACTRRPSGRSFGKLAGSMEIADRLGISRQRVQQLIARPDWPEPYETLAMGKVWLAESIEKWIAEHRPDVADTEPKPDTGPIGQRHGRPSPNRKPPRRPDSTRPDSG
jgi:predicted DNA-binding transcriptional regulator AlpA